MACEQLVIRARPRLEQTRMLLGFSGWMDGGDVSTGTVGWLAGLLKAKRLGWIRPEDFYIYSFPGSMEMTALFRPHVHIADGLITQYEHPENVFRYDTRSRLILFCGKEPNFRWSEYADCVLAVAGRFKVTRIYFVGSVAGVVPHTREPRLHCSVSHERLKGEMQQYGIRFSNYEGPASLVTYLTHRCAEQDTEMVALVAEIPAYVQGRNPICIESVLRRLSGILAVRPDLSDLRARRDAFEKKLNEVVQGKEGLQELIQKLESDYDNDVFDTEMGDLKRWLEQRGIRLD